MSAFPSPGATARLLVALRRALSRHGPALAGYLALTIVFLWAGVRHLPTRILSDGGDGSLYAWNLWAIPRSILDGENPFSTNDLFHPFGADTAFNTNMPFLAVVSAPLQWIFGLTVAVNLLQIFAVVASGFGAYLLALHVCGERRAAFVAGAAFALVPYRWAHLSQFSLNHTEVLPFGLLALVRLYERPTRGRAAALGAIFGITFLTDLYYTVFLGIAAAVVAAWHWRATFTRAMGVRLAQAAAVATVVALPLLMAMIRGLDSLDPLTNWANADNYSADLWSWVTPSDQQRIWGTRFVATNQEITGGERLAFPGFVVTALAAAATAGWGRRSLMARLRNMGLWLAVTATFFLLSLGPFLHVDGEEGDRFSRYGVRFDWPLPYYLLHSIPVVNGIRVPGRFSIVAILALCVLGASGLARLAAYAQARNRDGWAWAAPALALMLVAVEFYPRHVPTHPAQIPDAYEALAGDPGSGALLEVPLQWRTGFGAFGDQGGDHTIFMYWATHHAKPLVGGMVARYPEQRLKAIVETPVYRQVAELQQPTPVPDAPAAAFIAGDLADLGIGYVAYHRDRPRPRAEAYLAGLDLPVLADDGTVIIWKVPPSSP